MTPAPRISTEQAAILPSDIIELEAVVAKLPAEVRDSLAPLMERITESTFRRRRILMLIQETLGQLRLDMKYLVFDLEATRRERDALENDSLDYDEDAEEN